jgi:hypothetical protein
MARWGGGQEKAGGGAGLPAGGTSLSPGGSAPAPLSGGVLSLAVAGSLEVCRRGESLPVIRSPEGRGRSQYCNSNQT